MTHLLKPDTDWTITQDGTDNKPFVARFRGRCIERFRTRGQAKTAIEAESGAGNPSVKAMKAYLILQEGA